MGRKALLLTFAWLAISQPAAALGSVTWTNVCSQSGLGVATFSTCASSSLTVDADGWVTLKIWNLSGLPGSNTDPNAIFTAIGLENLGVVGIHNLSVLKPDGSVYEGWRLWRNGGGIPGPSIAFGASIDGINRGFASQYYTPGSPSQVQTNFSGSFASGYVQFRFRAGHIIRECPVNRPNCTNNQKFEVFVSEDFDPATTKLGLHVQGFPGGSSGYSCAASNDPNCTFLETTHAPEPMTMTLLATGLVSLGCAGLLRRRRRSQAAPGAE